MPGEMPARLWDTLPDRTRLKCQSEMPGWRSVDSEDTRNVGVGLVVVVVVVLADLVRELVTGVSWTAS